MMNRTMRGHGPQSMLPTLLLTLTMLLTATAIHAHADPSDPAATATHALADSSDPAATATHALADPSDPATTAIHAHADPSDPAATTTHPHADSGETPSPASSPDRAAIEQVLNNYTTAVTNSDEALFMTTLLDDQIPFFAAGDVATQPPSLKSPDTHAFAAFRRDVFHTNTRYRQTFDHVAIEQDKSLACVRLHFITRVVSSGAAADGWKTLQLLKVGDQWKIASEFYTVRSQRSNATPARQDAKMH
jgi:hypothetical protein